MLVDFSKAFDTVDHAIVLSKMNALDLPSSVKNWIIYFLTNRTQTTKPFDIYSTLLEINRSVVHGSGIGPYLYILMESDLHCLSDINKMFKFADDTNILVPEDSDVSMADEFVHVQKRACLNKMIINYAKTKEIVFHRPHPSKFSIQPSFESIELVRDCKLLGVYLRDKLSFVKHVNYILACCNKSFYLLKTLRDGGMPLAELNVIFCSLIVNRITYCLAAWGGYLTLEQAGKINAIFKRARRYGFVDCEYDVVGMLALSDSKMFRSIQMEHHCLHYILPLIRPGESFLRMRGHKFYLPLCRYDFYRNSFLPRCLYNMVLHLTITFVYRNKDFTYLLRNQSQGARGEDARQR
jgi:hypothetical protein